VRTGRALPAADQPAELLPRDSTSESAAARPYQSQDTTPA
jgi:hypothetical protein